jgi:hypothetical protein
MAEAYKKTEEREEELKRLQEEAMEIADRWRNVFGEKAEDFLSTIGRMVKEVGGDDVLKKAIANYEAQATRERQKLQEQIGARGIENTGRGIGMLNEFDLAKILGRGQLEIQHQEKKTQQLAQLGDVFGRVGGTMLGLAELGGIMRQASPIGNIFSPFGDMGMGRGLGV